jgi:hypothetical protein
VDTIQRPGRNATGVTSLDPDQAEAQMRLLIPGGLWIDWSSPLEVGE